MTWKQGRNRHQVVGREVVSDFAGITPVGEALEAAARVGRDLAGSTVDAEVGAQVIGRPAVREEPEQGLHLDALGSHGRCLPPRTRTCIAGAQTEGVDVPIDDWREPSLTRMCLTSGGCPERIHRSLRLSYWQDPHSDSSASAPPSVFCAGSASRATQACSGHPRSLQSSSRITTVCGCEHDDSGCSAGQSSPRMRTASGDLEQRRPEGADRDVRI